MMETAPRPADADRRRLLRMVEEDEIDLDFVAAEAGDRPLDAGERARHERIRAERGDRFHADLIFALAHERLPPDEAERLWAALRAHRARMALALGRPVSIAVGALDYLTAGASEEGESLVICRERRLASLADVALRDGLTGLFDHATFRARLRGELDRFQRHRSPFAVLLLDVDRFKEVNDRHGHRVGDAVLRRIARLIRDEARRIATPARVGGDELAVLLPGAGPSDAAALGERLRSRIAGAFASLTGVTVSIGVAACPDDAIDLEALLEAADVALYRSKRLGRDRVTRHDELARRKFRESSAVARPLDGRPAS